MGLRIAKIDEETITQELGNVSLKTLDDFSTRRLIGSDHVPVLFWVELAGQLVESTKSQNITVSCRLSAWGEGMQLGEVGSEGRAVPE